MLATELDKQSIDRSDLDAATTTGIAHFGRFNVVLPIRLQKTQGSKSVDQLRASLRASESL